MDALSIFVLRSDIFVSEGRITCDINRSLNHTNEFANKFLSGILGNDIAGNNLLDALKQAVELRLRLLVNLRRLGIVINNLIVFGHCRSVSGFWCKRSLLV